MPTANGGGGGSGGRSQALSNGAKTGGAGAQGKMIITYELFTVAFNVNGGSAVASQPVLNGGVATTPTTPTQTGLTFVGWFTDNGTFANAYNFATAVTGNLTLNAKWTAAVTFDSNGGTAVSTQTVTKGGTATQPADPTLSGSAFVSWYSDVSLTTSYSFGTVVNGDLTLYAKFVVPAAPTKLVVTVVPTTTTLAGNTFSVTVQAQNGSGTPGFVTQDTAISLAASGSGTLAGNTATITNGFSSVTLTGVTYTKAEAFTLTASVTSGDALTTSVASSSFTVNPNVASAANSGAVASPTTLAADGSAASTVTVTLQDAYNNALGAGTSVSWSVTGTANSISPASSGTTNGSGVASFTVKSIYPEIKTVTVNVGATLITNSLGITFTTPGSPSALIWDPSHTTTGSDTAGTWSTIAANWANGSADFAWPNNGNDTATFGSGAALAANFAVTMGSPVTVGNLTFNTTGANQYTLGNQQTITLAGTPAISVVGAATIASPLGGAGFSKTGAGTLTLSGGNTYTGTSLNEGTLTVGSGGTLGDTSGTLAVNNPNAGAGTAVVLNLATATDTTVGALSGTITPPSGGTNTATINTQITRNFTVNQTVAGSYDGVIAGAGSFTLGSLSTNTLILTGANTYAGTKVNAGTLQVNTGSSLGATTGALSLGTGSTGVIGTVGNLTLNTSAQVGAVTVVSNTATTTGADIGLLTIASGSTLTASSMTVGVAGGSSNGTKTALGTSGGGTLTVTGAFTMSPASPGSTTGLQANPVVDLSGLANFNNGSGSGTFSLGSAQESNATLTLANTSNSINVATLSIGNSSNTNYNLAYSTLNLGTGSNTLQASNIIIGAGKGAGALQFASTNTTGSVIISGTNGGAALAAVTIGDSTTTSGTYAPAINNSVLLLAGHNATVNASTVIVARLVNGINSSAPISNVTFDTGTFSATSVQMALTTGANGGSPNGTFTVGGASANSAATGIVNVTNNVILAGNTNNTNSGTAHGTLIINGGTVNVNTAASATGGIFDTTTSTSGSSATTLTLAGGTLNLNGGVIGGTATGVGKKNIGTLNFQSGTLMNVLEINGGATGLIKITDGTVGGGTLTLAGANGYTGATTVSAGTLALLGGSQASPITVSSGASLGFTLGSPTASTSSFNLSAGTIKITGTPTLASYTLITSSTGITGTPVLDTPISGYALQVSGNALNLVQSGYANWSGGAAADAKGSDGVANGVKWVLGAADPTANAVGLLPTEDNTSDATYFIFTFNRSDVANAEPNTSITVQYGDDLSGWTTAVDSVNGVIIDASAVPAAGFHTVVVKIPKSLAAGGKLFADLKVVVTP